VEALMQYKHLLARENLFNIKKENSHIIIYTYLLSGDVIRIYSGLIS